MTTSAQLRSGKGSQDENFPVASWVIKRRHRPVILAFYEFVRVADDIADHPNLASGEKLQRLDRLEGSLLGINNDEAEGITLRTILQGRGLSTRHAQDLLSAFKQDATKHRYADWDDLIDYCSRSAMPVGRFVLDVHNESKDTWPASDALCAALQIINHLQDCVSDYRKLDRVYIPLDAFAAHGIGVEVLGDSRAGSALRECLNEMVTRTAALLHKSQGLEVRVSDTRLAIEISVIQTLADRLLQVLETRDPLSERVHLTKGEALVEAVTGGTRALLRRFLRSVTPTHRYQTP
jgi:squalene synthase HpnC